MSLAIVLYAALFLSTLSDSDIARLGYDLLTTAGANDEIERAAFVVRTPAGTLELLPWPRGGFYSAVWTGPIPDEVVAVIHTHPRNRPIPSAADRAEAKRTGLPFYVISRAGLCVADAAGGVSCARRIPWLQRNGVLWHASLNWSERAGQA